MHRPSLVILAAVGLSGCAEYAMMGSGDMGINPGGSEDIQLARDLIAQGFIPDQTQFTAEGLFSEHDLPLSGAPCDEIVCPRAKATVHRPLPATDSVSITADRDDARLLVQLGFGSKLSMDEFERDDLDVAAVVDISCSMEGEKIELTKKALEKMVDQLGPDDHMSLVKYGTTPKLVRGRIAMDSRGRADMRSEIDRLRIDGSTDMESGMQKGFEQLRPNESGMHRLMVFSDALPNTGVTEDSAFLDLVREQSRQGNETTIFGVGTDLGAELANSMAKVRGGSLHFVSEDNVDEIFGDEFDLQVTPVGYDLEAHMLPREGLAVEHVYGAPMDGGSGVEIGASTLFLSSKRGGIAATFAGAPGGQDDSMEIGKMSVSFDPADGGARVTQTIDVAWEGGEFAGDADDLGVYKIDGLVDEYLALSAAADFCDGGDDAMRLVERTADRLDRMSAELEDAALGEEADLMRKLVENLAAGTGVCEGGGGGEEF